MSNELDDLFKRKLEDHSQEPSADAWKRIQSGQSKKNRGIVVFRWAAAALLAGALVTTTVWLTSRNESHELVKAKVNPVDSSKQSITAPAPLAANEQVTEPKKESPKAYQKQPVQQHATPTLQQLTSIAVDSTIKQPVAPIPNVSNDAVAMVPAKEKTIVIEYRLDPIQPQEAKAQPVLAAKEKSGFKKVVDFAIEAKNGEGPINFRETKDEIFALNFKKDKKNSK